MGRGRRKILNIEHYLEVLDADPVVKSVVDRVKEEFEFPLDSVLEVGTGTGKYLTEYLVQKSRDGEIDKFYGIEQDPDLFEESKRTIVRLSRTDVVSQEFFGGNPFDTIVAVLVLNHIYPDKKSKFIKNMYNNLKEGGKLILADNVIGSYKDEQERQEKIDTYFEKQIAYFKEKKNKVLSRHFSRVRDGKDKDIIYGDYRASLEYYKELIVNAGFKNLKVEKLDREEISDFGWHIITAEK